MQTTSLPVSAVIHLSGPWVAEAAVFASATDLASKIITLKGFGGMHELQSEAMQTRRKKRLRNRGDIAKTILHHPGGLVWWALAWPGPQSHVTQRHGEGSRISRVTVQL